MSELYTYSHKPVAGGLFKPLVTVEERASAIDEIEASIAKQREAVEGTALSAAEAAQKEARKDANLAAIKEKVGKFDFNLDADLGDDGLPVLGKDDYDKILRYAEELVRLNFLTNSQYRAIFSALESIRNKRPVDANVIQILENTIDYLERLSAEFRNKPLAGNNASIRDEFVTDLNNFVEALQTMLSVAYRGEYGYEYYSTESSSSSSSGSRGTSSSSSSSPFSSMSGSDGSQEGSGVLRKVGECDAYITDQNDPDLRPGKLNQDDLPDGVYLDPNPHIYGDQIGRLPLPKKIHNAPRRRRSNGVLASDILARRASAPNVFINTSSVLNSVKANKPSAGYPSNMPSDQEGYYSYFSSYPSSSSYFSSYPSSSSYPSDSSGSYPPYGSSSSSSQYDKVPDPPGAADANLAPAFGLSSQIVPPYQPLQSFADPGDPSAEAQLAAQMVQAQQTGVDNIQEQQAANAQKELSLGPRMGPFLAPPGTPMNPEEAFGDAIGKAMEQKEFKPLSADSPPFIPAMKPQAAQAPAFVPAGLQELRANLRRQAGDPRQASQERGQAAAEAAQFGVSPAIRGELTSALRKRREEHPTAGQQFGLGTRRRTQARHLKMSPDGQFGKLNMDMDNFHRMYLKAQKGGAVVAEGPMSADLFDLLTKRFSAKRNYAQDAVDAFRRLVDLAEIPKTLGLSGKNKLLQGRSVGPAPAYSDKYNDAVDPIPNPDKDPWGKNVKVKYITNPNDMIERLNVLMGSMNAGNENRDLVEEASEILDRLKDMNAISPPQYARLLDQLIEVMQS